MFLFLDRKIVNYIYNTIIDKDISIKDINKDYIQISINILFIKLVFVNFIITKGNFSINLVLLLLLLQYLSKDNILLHFFYTMHLLLPNKKERQLEISLIINEYIELREKKYIFILEQYKLNLKKEQLDFSEIKERLNKLKNDDFIFFIKNNFNFSKSFFKFYINKLNQVRDENLFIILSLLIPNRKELAPEALELILNNLDYNQEINEYLILQIKHIILDYDKNRELFQDFSLHQIKRLFRKKITLNNYLRLIYLLDQKERLNTNLYSIEEIITSKEKQILDYDIEKIKNNKSFVFKICHNYNDFKLVKTHFKNCVLNYIEQPFDIVAVYCYKSNKPIACISIKNKKIIEIKGPENIELSIEQKETLIMYVQSCFKNK
jgi:hypothetical protein